VLVKRKAEILALSLKSEILQKFLFRFLSSLEDRVPIPIGIFKHLDTARIVAYSVLEILFFFYWEVVVFC